MSEVIDFMTYSEFYDRNKEVSARLKGSPFATSLTVDSIKKVQGRPLIVFTNNTACDFYKLVEAIMDGQGYLTNPSSLNRATLWNSKGNLSNPNAVVTICYGQRREWASRQEALQFYLECMSMSEGAESERYQNIYIKLMQGLTICSDER